MDQLLPFAALALLIVIAPGPDLALVTRSVLGGGRRDGVLTAVGIASRAAVWALAAAAGLAALLTAAPQVLELIRWLGAGYLAFIGVRSIRRSLQPNMGPHPEAPSPRPGSWIAPYRIGLISNLLHPGQVIFYTGMLPQFIDPTGEPSVQVLRLGGLFVAIVLTWFTAYAFFVSAVPLDRWARLTPILTRITGVVLIAFAVRLVARL